MLHVLQGLFNFLRLEGSTSDTSRGASSDAEQGSNPVSTWQWYWLSGSCSLFYGKTMYLYVCMHQFCSAQNSAELKPK